MRVSGIVLGLWLVLLDRTALAQGSSVEEARERYRRGTAAYNLGHFAEAAREYEAAYQITLDPAMLFNTAQAHRLAGDEQKAILAYKGYLRAAPAGPQRKVAQQNLDELTKLAATRAPLAPSSSSPPTASRPTAPAPASENKAAASPPVAATAPDAVQASPVVAPTVPVATPTAPTETLVARPETPASAAERPLYTRWPFWAAVGATIVAGVVVGIVLWPSSDGGLPGQSTTYGSMSF